MKSREKFFLILLTIFALMFLTSLYMYKTQRSQLIKTRRIVRAYELFAMEKYDEFLKYMDLYKLDELQYLKKNLQKRKLQDLYNRGVSEFNLGNYSLAADFFKRALSEIEQDDPKTAEIVYLLSLSLVNSNRVNEAKLVLEQYINLIDLPYKQKIVELLAEIYRKQGELNKANELLKGVKK